MKKFIFFLQALSFIFLFSNACFAQNQRNPKVEYIDKLQQEILTILDSPSISVSKARQIFVDKYASQVDFEWNARMAIGRTWKDLTLEERDEYVCEYALFLAYTWLTKLKYDRRHGVSVTVMEQTKKVTEKDDDVTIKITLPDSRSFEIVFRIREFNQDGNIYYKVLNVVAEGIDLAMSYRHQFTSYIENNKTPQSIIKYLQDASKKNIANADFKVTLPQKYKCASINLVNKKYP
jgi:phospholipid transport system substrate-binding protein